MRRSARDVCFSRRLNSVSGKPGCRRCWRVRIFRIIHCVIWQRSAVKKSIIRSPIIYLNKGACSSIWIWASISSVATNIVIGFGFHRSSYVLNLRWDIFAWNPAADKFFKFSDKSIDHRNILRMLFVDAHIRSLFCPRDDQTIQMLSSFRRGYVHASKESNVASLVREFEKKVRSSKAGGQGRMFTARAKVFDTFRLIHSVMSHWSTRH